MKIDTGQFVETYLPIMEDISTIVKNYTYWLNKKHGNSIVVTPNFPDYSDQEAYNVIRYRSIPVSINPPYRMGLPKLDKQLHDKLKEQHFDLIHAHSPFSSGKIALKLAKERNIPIIATCHTDYQKLLTKFLKFKVLVKSYMKKIIAFYNQVDYLYTFDQSLVDILRFHGFTGRTGLLDYGTDFTYEEENINKDRDYINRLHNIKEDTNVLLYVGRLNKEYNIPMLIESFVNLRQFRQQFKVFFIGDGNYRNDMHKLIEEKNLSKFVTLIREVDDREQLKKYYERANLLLYPVPYITTGLVVREAASLECPSLVIKNIFKMIKDNYNGYTSENNSLLYAQRIISALNDRNKLEVGVKARITLAKDYEKVVEEIYEHYCEIIRMYKQY